MYLKLFLLLFPHKSLYPCPIINIVYVWNYFCICVINKTTTKFFLGKEIIVSSDEINFVYPGLFLSFFLLSHCVRAFATVAHNCHGKINSEEQIKITPGKLQTFTAKTKTVDTIQNSS